MNLLDQHITQTAQQIAEEVKDARAHGYFESGILIHQTKWNIGQAVVGHPEYRKFAKHQGKLIATVAKLSGIGERSLYDAINFYE